MHAYMYTITTPRSLGYLIIINYYARLAMLQDGKLHVLVYMYMYMYMCMHTYISGRSAVFPCHGDT